MIRKLTEKDIPQYQKLITKVWQQTYPGIINQIFLDNLSKTENERIELTKITFDEKLSNILILEIENNIIGFVKYGKTEDSLYPNTGEIFALYLLKEYKRKGYGKQLIQAAVKELIKLNFNTMIVGCIEQNPSNKFYQHIGGVLKSKRDYSKTGDNLKENIYYFDNIKNLL